MESMRVFKQHRLLYESDFWKTNILPISTKNLVNDGIIPSGLNSEIVLLNTLEELWKVISTVNIRMFNNVKEFNSKRDHWVTIKNTVV